MNWIKVATGIGRDSSLGAMSEALGVSVPTTTGHVVLLYTALAEGCESGDISDVPDAVVERWAMWRGKRGRFAAEFRAQLCTPEGVVRSWEKYNGAAIREARRSAERVKQWRDEKKRTGDETRTKRVTNAVTNTVTNGFRTSDETRRDVTTSTKDRSKQLTDSAAPDPARSVDRSVDALDAKFGGERPKPVAVVAPSAYAVQLAELEAAALPHERLALGSLMASHPQPYALVLELHACASGLHMIRGVTTGRTADVADVMRAVAEMAANGHAWSVKLFRGYLRRIADRPPEPASADERATLKLQAEIERRAPAELTRGERTADGNIVPVPITTEDTPEAREARRVAREAAMAAFRAGQRRAVEIDQQHGATQGEAA